jgi:hypothetical protein
MFVRMAQIARNPAGPAPFFRYELTLAQDQALPTPPVGRKYVAFTLIEAADQMTGGEGTTVLTGGSALFP